MLGSIKNVGERVFVRDGRQYMALLLYDDGDDVCI